MSRLDILIEDAKEKEMEHTYALTKEQIDELESWKETVRCIYDECLAHKEDTDAATVVTRIEQYHPEYFIQGKPFMDELQGNLDDIANESQKMGEYDTPVVAASEKDLDKAFAELDKSHEEYKMRQLLTFFKWGLNCERIVNSDDGDFLSHIDPPELEKGLWIEPRLAEKIRRLLREEIEYARTINIHEDGFSF